MPYKVRQRTRRTAGIMSEPTSSCQDGKAGSPARTSKKALFEEAADLTGRSLTEFVVSSAEEVATRTVREHEVLTLSGRDRRVFVEALLKPNPPNKRLRQAARRYKSITGI
jgi:uncharacterized protein (DUF1778 family)